MALISRIFGCSRAVDAYDAEDHIHLGGSEFLAQVLDKVDEILAVRLAAVDVKHAVAAPEPDETGDFATGLFVIVGKPTTPSSEPPLALPTCSSLGTVSGAGCQLALGHEQNNLIDTHSDTAERLAALTVKFDEDAEKTSRPAGEA
ncbi:MAG: hypothetical protein AMK72_03500 [Planctomycetes bacterium SM23_25]|nr:MAG: hypothetical protein AMK72_03500 [Planctomycetes bacterium SM23_25]